MFDVGQGDAVLVTTPRGGTILVDGGPDGRALEALRERLPYGATRIQAVVLTHPHADHLAGLPPVLERLEVERLFLPGAIVASRLNAAFLEDVRRRGIRVTFPSAPMTFELDGVELAFVMPRRPDAGVTKHPNDESLVLLVRHGAARVLLTGDLEAPGEAALLASGADVRAQVLKVGHHGSKTSTTAPFLAAVRPDMALISVGERNLYRHPAPVVLERLAAAGVATYRTDLDGDVVITCTRAACRAE